MGLSMKSIVSFVVLFLIVYFFCWTTESLDAFVLNNSVRCEIGYDYRTDICKDQSKSNCSGWSPPLFCWRIDPVENKRSQHGLNEREKAETTEMESAGFVWDPAGHPRWTHPILEVTALREHWMRDHDWDKRRAKKIAEAASLRLFADLRLGARFRLQNHIDTRRQVYVKLGSSSVARWEDVKDQQVFTDFRQSDFRVVELFEPFEQLTTAELEVLPKLPGVWIALADWHASKSAEAESQDYIEPMKWHDKREAQCKATAAAIEARWING